MWKDMAILPFHLRPYQTTCKKSSFIYLLGQLLAIHSSKMASEFTIQLPINGVMERRLLIWHFFSLWVPQWTLRMNSLHTSTNITFRTIACRLILVLKFSTPASTSAAVREIMCLECQGLNLCCQIREHLTLHQKTTSCTLQARTEQSQLKAY